MGKDILTVSFTNLSDLHKALGIAGPKHPLFSIIKFEDLPVLNNPERTKLILDFYQVTIKTSSPCKIQYGQTLFDFNEGVVSCFGPRQSSIIDPYFEYAKSGWLVNIHPEFLKSYALSQKIKQLGFFDYVINEALILSEDEQKSMEIIFHQLEREYHLPIDSFSQDVIVANLEVLLSYCNRYYKRQFVTRKISAGGILERLENILESYFQNNNNQGLPSPSYLANQLNISTRYLSDLLKQQTGHTTQQLIQDKIIDLSKDRLTSTQMSVSEIAYQLGFEYPQSFSKLFKMKTNQTPLEYRQSFN
jgi:AraC family transcriptional activator of pobA